LNSSIQRNLLGKVVESARANISLTNIRELEVFVPPVVEQKRWVDFCSGEGLLSSKVNQLIQETDNLFNSLLQRAFRGEL
jgi:type I restriction enzyme S subunit